MSDKGLLVVISELLLKQDQQAEILKRNTEILNDANKGLTEFIELTTKEFQEQYKFNIKFDLEFKKQMQFNEELKQFNEEQRRFNEGQTQFNQRLMDKLDDIEKALKK